MTDNTPPDKESVPDARMRALLGIGVERAKTYLRPRWIATAIGLVVVLLIVHSCFFGHSGPQYVTADVTRGPLSVTVSATGTLAPRDQVDVGAEVSGRIDKLYVDFNDHVKKGQPLAEINTDNLRAQLAQARAQLMTAQATLREDQRNRSRAIALHKSNALSQQDLDKSIADLARAKAGVQLAKAQVENYETSIKKAHITSPIDGVVLDRKVSEGQTVVAAMTTPVLFTLASDLSQMELDVDIDEADVGAVHAGQTAVFTVDAYPSRTFTAKLISVHNAPKTEQGVVTYQGVLSVENKDKLLKPGMTATADIRADHVENALLVPNGALRFAPPETELAKLKEKPQPLGANAARVWTDDDGKLVPHVLKIGPSDGRKTQVIKGDIKPGDKVIVDIKRADDKAG
ncbi:MAG TPA: efflux RND transporter periplasmic adaptor subunit [Rhizomicrobium sp.]|jgi:HlyD family secretion protein|nr:efflux RND transporter periplasmic adaptor subunit [Rhizomicrobium sp.]